MELVFLVLAFSLGLGLGRVLVRPDAGSRAFNPEEEKRVRALVELAAADSETADPAPRVALAEHWLARRDPVRAARELGEAVRRHAEQGKVRETGRRVLRALLLHEDPVGPAAASGLLTQDIDWARGIRRVILRLRDLTLGGVLELKKLELHIHDFEPGVRVQPLPRVVACRAVLDEEKLAFVLASRIEWDKAPIRDLTVRFREGRVEIAGSYLALGLPIGFSVWASARVSGPARIELAFPHPPRVAGVIPAPIDTILKALVSVVAAKRPGAVRYRGEATIELDLAGLGLPPVDFNLREIRVGDGRLEVLCAAEGVEVPAAVAAPELEEPDEPDEDDEPEDEAAAEAGPAAPKPGVFETLRAFLGGPAQGPVDQALDRARGRILAGEPEAAVRLLEPMAAQAEAGTEDAARLVEGLAEARLAVGGEESLAKAARALDALIEARPERPRASLLLAKVLRRQGDEARAEERARTGFRLDPFEVEAASLLFELYEARGAVRAADRMDEVRDALNRPRGLLTSTGVPVEPGKILPRDLQGALEHRGETTPTARLVRALTGSLGWLDPRPDPAQGDRQAWPVFREEYPRLHRLAGAIAASLQMRPPQLVVRLGAARGPMVVRGVRQPWVEAPEKAFPGLSEGALAFEVGRCLHLARTGRGVIPGLGERELELFYAFLGAVAEEAHRNHAGPTTRGDEGARGDGRAALALPAGTLDAFVSADVRAGALAEALAYHDFDPSFDDLLEWQRAVSAGADRAGLLYAGSVLGAIEGLSLVESPVWAEIEERGLVGARNLVKADAVAWRIQELVRFAAEPELEELERALYS